MTPADIILVVKALVELIGEVYADQKMEAAAVKAKFESIVSSFRAPDFSAEDAKIDAALEKK